jgi:site-specific recombinase XerD
MEKAERREVIQVWRQSGLKPSSIVVYLRWVDRFKAYCDTASLDELRELTFAGAREFAQTYAREHAVSEQTAYKSAHCALRAWAVGMAATGHPVPSWGKPRAPSKSRPSILEEFAAHLRLHRGNPESTICKKLTQISALLAFLRSRRRTVETLQLRDIDAFALACGERYARTTTADICSCVRTFLRFLHATGRVPHDLSAAVAAPTVRNNERPRRALPWDDVRRILRAVDRSTYTGRRDYAMLLMMSTYGFGAGEVIRLTLDDIDWRAATLRVVRPKTGVELRLPLLPAIARALVSYLKHGRPPATSSRHLLVSMKAPYLPFGAASAVRHVLIKHARIAGVSAPYLGSHVLRHSHACRQVEQGVAPKIIGDILGHRRPESTSSYIRIATEGLRALALPVPQ